MTGRANDIEEKTAFPPAPVAASEVLVPITSWVEMFREKEITRVEFDLFWLENVEAGAAYFFSWMADPRSTVLVVWDDEGPTHIECRKVGDLLTSETESLPIISAVTQSFRSAGFGSRRLDH